MSGTACVFRYDGVLHVEPLLGDIPVISAELPEGFFAFAHDSGMLAMPLETLCGPWRKKLDETISLARLLAANEKNRIRLKDMLDSPTEQECVILSLSTFAAVMKDEDFGGPLFVTPENIHKYAMRNAGKVAPMHPEMFGILLAACRKARTARGLGLAAGAATMAKKAVEDADGVWKRRLANILHLSEKEEKKLENLWRHIVEEKLSPLVTKGKNFVAVIKEHAQEAQQNASMNMTV